MPTATLTSKGQITLPRQVRQHLGVETGDAVDFVIGADGEVRVRVGEIEVTELKGLFKQPGRRPVTVDEMDAAIRRVQSRRR